MHNPWDEWGGGEDFQEDEGREYEFELLHETDLAFLMLIEDEEVWLPKSRVDACFEGKKSIFARRRGTVFVPDWLAEEKGL